MAARRAQDDRAARPDVNALAAGRRSGRAGLSGAGLRRPRRAVVGRAGARRDVRPHPQFGRRPSSPAPRSRRSATRPAICSRRCAPTGRRAARHGAAGRRRHGGERRHHAVPRRHPGRAGRPAGRDGDDRARRRLSRRPCRRPVPRSRRLCRDAGSCERRFVPRMDDGDARAQMGRLARRGRAATL